MKNLSILRSLLALIFGLITSLIFSHVCCADEFNLQHFDIDGIRIGDSQNHFLHEMTAYIPATANRAKRVNSPSLLYTKPISCKIVESGVSRCEGKFAEMKKPSTGKQKEFDRYRDVVANFTQNNQLAFLSTITTTRHNDRESCLRALSDFYKQATSKTEKPSVIYPRNQLDIYYIKIDEQPFTTRMVGKLDSAFSMVWQKKRGDWSAFYSIDFGCRASGHMVVNSTLYDGEKKAIPASRMQVSSLKTEN